MQARSHCPCRGRAIRQDHHQFDRRLRGATWIFQSLPRRYARCAIEDLRRQAADAFPELGLGHQRQAARGYRQGGDGAVPTLVMVATTIPQPRQLQKRTAMATPTADKAAIAALKKDPTPAPEFDAKYGDGRAAIHLHDTVE